MKATDGESLVGKTEQPSLARLRGAGVLIHGGPAQVGARAGGGRGAGCHRKILRGRVLAFVHDGKPGEPVCDRHLRGAAQTEFVGALGAGVAVAFEGDEKGVVGELDVAVSANDAGILLVGCGAAGEEKEQDARHDVHFSRHGFCGRN